MDAGFRNSPPVCCSGGCGDRGNICFLCVDFVHLVVFMSTSVFQEEVKNAEEGANADDKGNGLPNVGDRIDGGDTVPMNGKFRGEDDGGSDKKFRNGIVCLKSLDE